MKNGFKSTVDKVLRKYGLLTRDCIGAVWSDSELSLVALRQMGYRVEMGINKPDYDYILISKNNSTLGNILKALTLVKVGCIIMFRADSPELKTIKTWNTLSDLFGLHVYEYGEGKILGVIFKGKKD